MNIRLRKAIGAALIELRRKRGISQLALAREAEIDRSYMSGMECGLHNPTLETIWKMIPILRVTPKKFFDVVDKLYNSTDVVLPKNKGGRPKGSPNRRPGRHRTRVTRSRAKSLLKKLPQMREKNEQ